ncbi:peptide chain release factor 1 [Pseudomonas phage Kremar]|uniref:Peptide chain release factor 1 n=1 Tax=Pseudomonas phage Kremar TaxID=2928831 RepID=A0AAE9GNA7_9CAUD|nr:peptide chain release factor 1 [Pseudomonas phage Kremar]UOL48429.1 peptide chain release factor 1 [Pseudomonas phage Kremar]
MALNPTDVQIDIWPQTARQGGMQVGTIGSGVTALHIPSQLGITCNSERSQWANKEKAMQLLESLLLAVESEKRFPLCPEVFIPPPTPYVASKVLMIKTVRERAGCGLKEAKEAVDKMGTIEGALLHLTGSTGYCDREGGCVCGGDLPAIREGCYNWQK